MARGFTSEDEPRPSAGDGSTVTIAGAVCLRDSANAIHVRALGIEFWCPQSVIHDDSEVFAKGGAGKLVLMTWWVGKQPWAKKVGIE